MASPDDSYDLNMAAAALRANSADVPLLLKALCDQLGATLGARLRIERGSGRRRKSDTISSVQITMGHDLFEARVDGASLHCTVGHLSGGIRIRTEALDMDGWIVRLLQSLQSEAAHSDSARQALENIVIGGNQ